MRANQKSKDGDNKKALMFNLRRLNQPLHSLKGNSITGSTN